MLSPGLQCEVADPGDDHAGWNDELRLGPGGRQEQQRRRFRGGRLQHGRPAEEGDPADDGGLVAGCEVNWG